MSSAYKCHRAQNLRHLRALLHTYSVKVISLQGNNNQEISKFCSLQCNAMHVKFNYQWRLHMHAKLVWQTKISCIRDVTVLQNACNSNPYTEMIWVLLVRICNWLDLVVIWQDLPERTISIRHPSFTSSAEEIRLSKLSDSMLCLNNKILSTKP